MSDLVNPGGWSAGDQLTAAQVNALDAGQNNSWVRDGETMLTADCEIDGAFALTFANNIVYISASKLNLTGSNWPILAAAHAVTDYAPGFNVTVDSASNWSLIAGSGYVAEALGSSNTHFVAIDLGSLPVGMVITDVTVPIASPNTVSLPATMPQIQLLTYAPTSTSPTTIGTASDTSANAAAFIAKHRLTLSGLSHTVANALQYRILVTNMGSTSAVVGMKVGRPFITGTTETLRTA